MLSEWKYPPTPLTYMVFREFVSISLYCHVHTREIEHDNLTNQLEIHYLCNNIQWNKLDFVQGNKI